jgi:hypothetical protein
MQDVMRAVKALMTAAKQQGFLSGDINFKRNLGEMSARLEKIRAVL